MPTKTNKLTDKKKRKCWHTARTYMATDTLCFLSVSLRSGPVTAVRFAGPNTVASSSQDGSTKFWDVETGQEKAEAVPEGFKFPEQGGAQKKQRVGDYVVAAKGQTLVIFEAPHDKAETAADGKAETAPKVETAETAEAEETAAVAFFQCASEITGFDVAGANVAVGCADGHVLQLFAAVLQTRV